MGKSGLAGLKFWPVPTGIRHGLLMAVALAALLFTAGAPRAQSADPPARFELLHLWAVAQEAYALRAFSDPMKAAGVDWSENQVATNFLGVRDLFAKRLALGAPPSGLFWLGGERPGDVFEQEYFRLIPDRFGEQSFSQELVPEVYEQVKSGSNIMLLPVGMHLQNRMLLNAGLMERLNLPLPQTWQELLAVAPKLQENGVYAVAMSDERWQLRFFIMSIMAEQFTADDMRALLAGTRPASDFTDQLSSSIRIFLALREFTPTISRDLKWASVVERVRSGDAFAAFMGDFVAPLIAGSPGIRCSAPPGNDYVIWSFDTIALVKSNDPAVIAGQDRLIEVVMNRANHDEYILRKGGVPVYRGMDVARMDDCSKASVESWDQAKTKILLTASEWTQTLDTIASILRLAWRDPESNAEQVTADVLTAVDLLNQRGRQPTVSP